MKQRLKRLLVRLLSLLPGKPVILLERVAAFLAERLREREHT